MPDRRADLLETRRAPTKPPTRNPSGPVTKIPISGPRLPFDNNNGPANPAMNKTPPITIVHKTTCTTGFCVWRVLDSIVMVFLQREKELRQLVVAGPLVVQWYCDIPLRCCPPIRKSLSE